MANSQFKRTLRNDLAFDIPALAPFVRRKLDAQAMTEIWEIAADGMAEGMELVDMHAFAVAGGGRDIEFTLQRRECVMA